MTEMSDSKKIELGAEVSAKLLTYAFDKADVLKIESIDGLEMSILIYSMISFIDQYKGKYGKFCTMKNMDDLIKFYIKQRQLNDVDSTKLLEYMTTEVLVPFIEEENSCYKVNKIGKVWLLMNR